MIPAITYAPVSSSPSFVIVVSRVTCRASPEEQRKTAADRKRNSFDACALEYKPLDRDSCENGDDNVAWMYSRGGVFSPQCELTSGQATPGRRDEEGSGQTHSVPGGDGGK